MNSTVMKHRINLLHQIGLHLPFSRLLSKRIVVFRKSSLVSLHLSHQVCLKVIPIQVVDVMKSPVVVRNPLFGRKIYSVR